MNSSACTAWARRCTEALIAEENGAAWPGLRAVGGHRDLLAYLVRRLFGKRRELVVCVDRCRDPSVPVATILRRPQDTIAVRADARHPRIPYRCDLLWRRRARIPAASNSATVRASLALSWRSRARRRRKTRRPLPIIERRRAREGQARRAVVSPIDGAAVGQVSDAGLTRSCSGARRRGRRASPAWAAQPVEERAVALERTADLYQQNRDTLLALLQHEGGKTLEDASGGSTRGNRLLPLLCGASA
jgi:RHH-type proline utilization regulon transcriptional repressor/proline dehydrogenase/delta 1-pyrroline-5-carboxylate dehydrogenase